MCRVPTRCLAGPRGDPAKRQVQSPLHGGCPPLLEGLSGRCAHMLTHSRPSWAVPSAGHTVLLSLGHLWGHICLASPQTLCEPQKSWGWGSCRWLGRECSGPEQAAYGTCQWLEGPLRAPAAPGRTRSGEHLRQKRHPDPKAPGARVLGRVPHGGAGQRLRCPGRGVRGGGTHASPGSPGGQDIGVVGTVRSLGKASGGRQRIPLACPNQGLPTSACDPPHCVGLRACVLTRSVAGGSCREDALGVGPASKKGGDAWVTRLVKRPTLELSPELTGLADGQWTRWVC